MFLIVYIFYTFTPSIIIPYKACPSNSTSYPPMLSKTMAELLSSMQELTTSDQDSGNNFYSHAIYLNTVSDWQTGTKICGISKSLL